MALIVGCWHSMIVVGIVAHTQVFFDTKQNFHQMVVVAHCYCYCCCYNNSNYSTAVDYLASFDVAAVAVGH